MRKEIEIRKDGKARFRLADKTMATRWFKDKDSALQHLGRLVLLHGDTAFGHLKWTQIL